MNTASCRGGGRSSPARPFDGRRVLLGVTGGIASYKSIWLARLLTQAGAAVDVVMTSAACEFVGAVTFEAVTGRAVHTNIFARGGALDHVRLARECDLMVIAPATADFLARAAHGLADDMLAATLLANTSPVLFVPAMNDRMWANAQTQRNVAHLRAAGHTVLEPDTGPLAFGEGSGAGRMHEPDVLLAHVGRALEPASQLSGRRVVVTAGATREPIDPVRFISNHSTGKMGLAIAEAAWRRGAEVTLIVGHIEVTVPPFIRVVHSATTAEMADATATAVRDADVLVMAAAPADFSVADPASAKIKKGAGAPGLSLVQAPDILLATRAARSSRCITVGFALETDDTERNAHAKLVSKDLDLIVLNDATEEGAGFGVDTNRVTLFGRDGSREALPLMSKRDVAEILLDRVSTLIDVGATARPPLTAMPGTAAIRER